MESQRVQHLSLFQLIGYSFLFSIAIFIVLIVFGMGEDWFPLFNSRMAAVFLLVSGVLVLNRNGLIDHFNLTLSGRKLLDIVLGLLAVSSFVIIEVIVYIWGNQPVFNPIPF